MLKITHAVLVYQAGIANVFHVGEFGAKHDMRGFEFRLMQGCYSECESFARGMVASGTTVVSMACNEAGDISKSKWYPVTTPKERAEFPYNNSWRVVYGNLW